MLLAGCGSKQTVVQPSRHDLETIFEDELRVPQDPSAILTIKRLGVDRLRVYARWSEVAPGPTSPQPPAGFNAADPGAYPPNGWRVLDEAIRMATRVGLSIDLTIGGPAPAWATGAGAPHGGPVGVWRPSARAYGQFVRAVATRYDGRYRPTGSASVLPRVSFFAIWNEPNLGPDLAPQTADQSRIEVSPALYRGLLDAAWGALRASGHGKDTVLIGETAPKGQSVGDVPGTYGEMVPLRFIRALYCVDGNFRPLQGSAAAARMCPTDQSGSQRFPAEHPALFQAEGFADHPYPQGGTPPNRVTPDEPDFADLAALPRLESTLDNVRATYGSYPKLPIYNTEFGYQTNPPETIAYTTTPAAAALYLNWAEYLSWRDPRMRSYDQFLLRDPPTANAVGGFATGLEFKDGTPKATFAAFRMPIFLPNAGHGSGPVEVWGCVRPAHEALHRTGGTARVLIQFRANSSVPFRTVDIATVSDPAGYFDTSVKMGHQGQVRLTWSYPRGPTIHSRVANLSMG